MTARHAWTLLAAVLLAAASRMDAAVADVPSTKSLVVRADAADNELWWHHAIFYQIYPRSFMDSNGDGIGDLNGITSRLEYLKDIGVRGVWLSPFYPSPQKDFGYDISDFKNVDPTYGTLADFQEMTKKAHDLELKVVVDLVPNHSSDKHEWFEKSVNREGKYTDYYVWADGKMVNGVRQPPNNWVSHFRFSAWEWNEQRGQYYLHQFVKEQPDLNYRSADVVQEMKDVYTFWMNQGVDGFRVDALPFLFEDAALPDEPLNTNQTDPEITKDDYDFYWHPYTMDDDGTYDMLQQWREVVDKHPDNMPRVIMTECYTTFPNTMRYYGTKERPGASFPFNFQFISNLDKSSSATDIKWQIDQWMNAMDDTRWPNWVIGNHDNPRVATRYPNMADAMNMISLTLPGTAMTYYGEELGMTDAFITWAQTKDPSGINAGPNRYLKTTRDPCRTPMQWDNTTPSAGFSTSHETWMPTNPNYWQLNVEAEKKDPKSHLNIYKDLTAARQTDTLKKGALATKVLKDDVLVITRSLQDKDTYITVVNVGSWAQTIESNDLLANAKLTVYSASASSSLNKGDAFSSVTLRPKTGFVVTTGSVTVSSASTAQTAVLLSVVLAFLGQLL